MDNRFNVGKYGGRIFRPGVIPRNINPWIVTPNFSLQCKGKIFTGVLEDEMYMSDIIAKAIEMDIPWNEFPLDQCSSRSIYWEYGVSFPMSKFFAVGGDAESAAASRQAAAAGEDSMEEQEGGNNLDPDDSDAAHLAEFCRRLAMYGNGVLFMNPTRHSMMLFVVDPRFSDDPLSTWTQCLPVPCRSSLDSESESVCTMDGGPCWKPKLQLVHEFSLLPQLEPFSLEDGDDEDMMQENRFWGGQTPACSSVSDMQEKLFRLTGFGPYPYPRRAGVLLHISPCEDGDDDVSKKRLGCIVSHTCGVHGCRYV